MRIIRAAQHALHLTRAVCAPLYRRLLHSFAGLFRVVVMQTRRGQVSSAVKRRRPGAIRHGVVGGAHRGRPSSPVHVEAVGAASSRQGGRQGVKRP